MSYEERELAWAEKYMQERLEDHEYRKMYEEASARIKSKSFRLDEEDVFAYEIDIDCTGIVGKLLITKEEDGWVAIFLYRSGSKHLSLFLSKRGIWVEEVDSYFDYPSEIIETLEYMGVKLKHTGDEW